MEILKYLPANIAGIINRLKGNLNEDIIEIRMRTNRPLEIITPENDFFVNCNGLVANNPEAGFLIDEQEMERAFLMLTKHSLYAVERQLKEGFITIPGGHRVGFTGQAVIENNRIKIIKNINSLNYRITREMIGIGNKLIKKIYNFKDDGLFNTLIISPPLCGKTTMLRDLIRIISDGLPEIGLRGRKVVVVDERSEIAGAYNGIPQNKIGNRTDLLDNCPKSQGMLIVIRSMSPEVLAIDEIGRQEDIDALNEALTAGVSIITTIHGQNLNSIRQRPKIDSLIKSNLFQRYVILSRSNGIGTIEGIKDYQGREVK